MVEEEKELKFMKREDCFANRKDGKCHALIEKNCENCKFYTPRDKVKNNPFYKFSYENEIKMKFLIKRTRIKKEDILN